MAQGPDQRRPVDVRRSSSASGSTEGGASRPREIPRPDETHPRRSRRLPRPDRSGGCEPSVSVSAVSPSLAPFPRVPERLFRQRVHALLRRVCATPERARLFAGCLRLVPIRAPSVAVVVASFGGTGCRCVASPGRVSHPGQPYPPSRNRRFHGGIYPIGVGQFSVSAPKGPRHALRFPSRDGDCSTRWAIVASAQSSRRLCRSCQWGRRMSCHSSHPAGNQADYHEYQTGPVRHVGELITVWREFALLQTSPFSTGIEPVRSESLRALGLDGYVVKRAGSGPEGIAAIRQEAQVDLLAADLQMPGLSGDQMVRQIRMIRQTFPALT